MGTLTGRAGHLARRDRAEPARIRRAVRRPQGAPVLDLPRARVRRHHPAERRLVRALPPAHRRDQAEHPPHRPDHRQDAARPGPGAGAGHHPPEAGPRLRARSSRRAACTASTPSATAGRTRTGSGCATPASSASRRCRRSCPASWSPTRWPSWPASTRSWAAWTSKRWTSGAAARARPLRAGDDAAAAPDRADRVHHHPDGDEDHRAA